MLAVVYTLKCVCHYARTRQRSVWKKRERIKMLSFRRPFSLPFFSLTLSLVTVHMRDWYLLKAEKGGKLERETPTAERITFGYTRERVSQLA